VRDLESVTGTAIFEVVVMDMSDVSSVADLVALDGCGRARKVQDLRFITMSPGNTAGTGAMRDLPLPIRILVQHVLMR